MSYISVYLNRYPCLVMRIRSFAQIIVFLVLSVLAVHSSSGQSLWVQTNGPYGGTVMDLAEGHDGVVYAAAGAGLFASASAGQYWTAMNLPGAVTSVAIDASRNMFAGTSGRGIYQRRQDSDKAYPADGPWLLFDEGIRGVPITSLLITSGGGVLAGGGSYKWMPFSQARYGGIFRLTAQHTWEERAGKIDYGIAWSLREHPDGDVFAALNYGVYLSSDNGLSWTRVHDARVHDVGIRSDGTLVIGWNGKLLESADRGETWAEAADLPENCCLSLHYGRDGRLWGYSNGSAGAQVRYSDDDGATWEDSGFATIHIHRLLPLGDGKALVATHFGGVDLIDPDAGAVSERHAGIAASDVSTVTAIGDSLVLAGTSYLYECGDYCGSVGAIYRSTDRGSSWERVHTGIPALTDFAYDETRNLVFATALTGMYRSEDFGRSWSPVVLQPADDETWCGGGLYKVHVSDRGTLHVGFGHLMPLIGGGLARSEDGGATWSCVPFDDPTSISGVFAQDASGRLYSSSFDGVIVSDDNGESWAPLGSELPPVRAVAAHGERVFVLADGAVYRLNDSRTDWQKTAFSVPHPTLLETDPEGHLFVGTLQNGIFSSSNNGASWQLVDDGLLGVSVSRLAFSTDGVAYAATTGRGVFRNLAPSVSAEPVAHLPGAKRLSAAYPNPFVRETNLTVSLSRVGEVSLRVYDLLGREVAVLAQQFLPAGEHMFTWRPADVSPGVYAVVLSSARGTESRFVVVSGR